MNILILGANSDVAFSIARIFAEKEQANFYLASRNIPLLQKKATDLEVRYPVKVGALYFDALDFASHAAFYEALSPKPDGVVLAFGDMGSEETARRQFEEARRIIDVNLTGAVSILEIIAADFERRGHGFIIGISSVAGERGRQSNYIYGSAKGALRLYLSGLRNRLSRRSVHVMTVLPGFINTKMTAHLDLPEKLTARPEDVARDVYQAYIKNKNIVYSRWFWKWIMWVIKVIPENIFKKLNL